MAIEKRDIAEKIGKIRLLLQQLRSDAPRCSEAMADELHRDAILYRLYILSDRVLRLAETVCKIKKLGYPLTYSDFIYRLGDAGVIDREFAYRFASIAKFRNFLAHEYGDIDDERICEMMQSDLSDVENFLEQIERSLGV